MTIVQARAQSLAAKLAVFAADIKISHTVFAMPWAVLATVMAWDRVGGAIAGKLALVVLCMATARTVAMAANRIFDAQLDARNPRTARRAIPGGRLSRRFFWGVLGTCAIVFVAATALFWLAYQNPWPGVLGAPVLAYLCFYPFMKRFTWGCHFYLGLALGLAPICAWVAVAGSIAWEPIVMAAAVMCWTAGFDIIYACLDYQSDLETQVASVPARMGIRRALSVSRITHATAAALLIWLGVLSPQLSTSYFIGSGCAIALLLIEHAMVKADDLSKVNVAFFAVNGVISLVVGISGIADVVMQ